MESSVSVAALDGLEDPFVFLDVEIPVVPVRFVFIKHYQGKQIDKIAENISQIFIMTD